jgi:glutathionylspermidine synthase
MMSASRAIEPTESADPAVELWDATRELDSKSFAEVRWRMMLDGCKWDPQVGDVATLAPFPLIIPANVIRDLERLAERLSEEALHAERALLERPKCFGVLGFSRALTRVLSAPAAPTPAAARVLRYDFHPTAQGWRISEANADVPGGYSESSLFPRLMAEHVSGASPAGDPAAALADAMVASMGRPGSVGLLTGTGHMEDHQVIAYLARVLRGRGCTTVCTHPRQIAWKDGFARLICADGSARAVDVIMRFYQAEWLGRRPPSDGWPGFFRGGSTPVCNPGTALAIESKRFPLVWDRLGLELPTWRALLPTTCDPRDLGWRFGDGWVLKTALCNNGDTVALPSDRERWTSAVWGARLQPGLWVAQRWFETTSIATPLGPMYPCLGLYTIDGRAAGVYGRIARRPLIDAAAIDVAVLVGTDDTR